MTITLVTGATRGIGFETARRLVEAGQTVWLGARDLAAGERAASSVGARAVQLDVTDGASIRSAAERIEAEGGLDVLVNNAGIAGEQRRPPDSTIDDLRRVFATNVFGATEAISVMAPLLESSDVPVVVNVSSAVGSLALNSQPGSRWTLLAYPMSKSALNMLTVQYAKAYPRWRVNAVTPGLTATDFIPGLSGSAAVSGAHSVEEGAEIVVRMALIGADGPTGTFVSVDGPIPW